AQRLASAVRHRSVDDGRSGALAVGRGEPPVAGRGGAGLVLEIGAEDGAAAVRARRRGRGGGRGRGRGGRVAAGRAVEGEVRGYGIGRAPCALETELGGAARGQGAVPARVHRGHGPARLGDGGVPRRCHLLVTGVTPGQAPAGDGGTEVGDLH